MQNDSRVLQTVGVGIDRVPIDCHDNLFVAVVAVSTRELFHSGPQLDIHYCSTARVADFVLPEPDRRDWNTRTEAAGANGERDAWDAATKPTTQR